MNKFATLYDYLINESTCEALVTAWNAYCGKKGLLDKIYLNNSKNILQLFKSSVDLADVLEHPSKYDRNDRYFIFAGKFLFSFCDPHEYCAPSDFAALTTWLVENGDAGLGFIDLDDYLEKAFINEHFKEDADDAKAIIDELSKDEPIDFLMEDWQDIATNVFVNLAVYQANKR